MRCVPLPVARLQGVRAVLLQRLVAREACPHTRRTQAIQVHRRGLRTQVHVTGMDNATMRVVDYC